MAVVRVLSPHVGRVIVANLLQVKAIAHAHVKTDKIDAGMLAALRAADFLPEIWLPDADTDVSGGWWRGATNWSGTARGLRTRCTRSCMLI